MGKKKPFVTAPGYGLPEWTEIGSETGLDPLGMARPSEIIYQGLLPGISTITVRLRYYSFLPWMVHTYISNGNSADPDEFFKFQRNAEALFALIGMNDPYDGGLAGSNWASRTLSEATGNVIDFGESAQSKNKGLLKNKNGAFGGIYGPQLQEMGLITTSADHGIKVPTDRGTKMAKAFEETLGASTSIVIHAIKTGQITRTDLDSLSHLKPSSINPNSREGKLLTSVLLGMEDDLLEEDFQRRDSLIRILKYTRQSNSKPTDYDVRWHWFQTLKSDETLDPWLAYHVNDLLILGYETLLKRALEIMSGQPDYSITFDDLRDLLLTEPCKNLSNEVFLESNSLSDDIENVVNDIIKLGGISEFVSDDAVVSAIKLIRIILGWATSYEADLKDLFLQNSSFNSISTELAFVKSLKTTDIQSAMSKVLTERVLKRHLWVASRKFRGQKKYSFLFEPVDGGQSYLLRYRNPYSVKIGYPRISQAIQFLEDLKLIGEANGLTDLGHKILDAA